MSTDARPDARPAITLDQQLALAAAVSRLALEFAGAFDRATVERLVHSSYDQLAGTATVANFLPLLAERFGRQRLQAMARLEGRHADGRPVVLFLCRHNAGRSQMALGFFEHHASGRAVAWSGGAEPDADVNPTVVTAMGERGIDIADAYPKPWTDEIVRAADVIVTMGCENARPHVPGTRYVDWVLDDPQGRDVEAIRPVRDEIERRVLVLLRELGLRDR
ncbi:arsenate reductase ArsC [Nocardioides sp. LHD-245]|uniref:arsenate reductase ArsC n=1 Tax=Nocardioides sp. LHD-245 TaxID=3051387 RepID=UPI0027E1E457|nr:arsenate reductase ArsC [Nocardioides sp. LHD-245]